MYFIKFTYKLKNLVFILYIPNKSTFEVETSSFFLTNKFHTRFMHRIEYVKLDTVFLTENA